MKYGNSVLREFQLDFGRKTLDVRFLNLLD